MQDLTMALALVLVIEGALWTLFPSGMRRAAALALAMDENTLRRYGLITAALGVGVVWLVRG